MIGFTSIAQKGMMLLVWTNISITEEYDPSQNSKNRRKHYPKQIKKNLIIAFFIFSGELFLSFKELWLMPLDFVLGRQIQNRNPITIYISIVAPTLHLNQMWIKKRPQLTCLMTGIPMMTLSYIVAEHCP